MRVFGRVDGVEVIFTNIEGNRWQVPVPLDVDGEYVIEVMAEDEAGNVAYMAKMLFVVNNKCLNTYMIPYPYLAQLQEGYKSHIYDQEYTVQVQGNYTTFLIDSSYITELQR